MFELQFEEIEGFKFKKLEYIILWIIKKLKTDNSSKVHINNIMYNNEIKDSFNIRLYQLVILEKIFVNPYFYSVLEKFVKNGFICLHFDETIRETRSYKKDPCDMDYYYYTLTNIGKQKLNKFNKKVIKFYEKYEITDKKYNL
jgi:hypothetical protein